MHTYIEYLSRTIPENDSLKVVKLEAQKYYNEHTATECYDAVKPLYGSCNFQIQEVGVLLCGYVGKDYPDAVVILLLPAFNALWYNRNRRPM